MDSPPLSSRQKRHAAVEVKRPSFLFNEKRAQLGPPVGPQRLGPLTLLKELVPQLSLACGLGVRSWERNCPSVQTQLNTTVTQDVSIKQLP